MGTLVYIWRFTHNIGSWADYFRQIGKNVTYESYGLIVKSSGYGTYYGSVGIDTSVNGLNTDWGSIPDVISVCGEGWQTLTADEWDYIFSTRTSGATVSGTSNARYTCATIRTDVTGINGVIIFPDGVTIDTGEATTWGARNARSTWGTKCTAAQWDALEAKGCVFLPAGGASSSAGTANSIGTMVGYWTSSGSSNGYCSYVYCASNYAAQVNYGEAYIGHNVRLVKAVN